MKKVHLELWSIWLYGCLLIGLSIYSTQKLPSINDQINKSKLFDKGFSDSASPKIMIFSAPNPFIGPTGKKQVLAVRSWLGLSRDVTVVLFSQHPSVAYFASDFSSRVSIEPNVDFTFLGTPFFHSVIARTRASTSDIYVLVDPETILLSDFISTLNYAHKFDHDWLFFAISKTTSNFSFHLDEAGKHWVGENGKRIRTQKLQEILVQSSSLNCFKTRMVMAWNNGDIPLHNGVLPPFLYGSGVHSHWVITEAVKSNFRFVFDASSTITSFYVNDFIGKLGLSDHEEKGWEMAGNLHLGAGYGSMFFHQIDYSNIIKLSKCNGKYYFVDKSENYVHPFDSKSSPRIWKQNIFKSSWKNDKAVACVDAVKSRENVLNCSLKDRLKPFIEIELPFSLESLLSIVADKNKTVVLAIAGNSYKDMLMSWVCRLRRLRITNFMVCALDHEIYHFSVLQGLPVFKDPLAPQNISFNNCHFGSPCFRRVTKVKSRLVLQILKLGYNVLLSDVDVYWFGNPVPLLSSFGPAVLAAQSDEYNKSGPINLPRRLNSGFYFARSDNSTVAAMEKVVKHASTSDLSEQPSFYDTLCGEGGSYRISDNRCLEPETNLTVHFLDRDLFPNGAYLGLWEKKNVKEYCVTKGCLILHNNWIPGRRKKLERQILSGLWEYDSSTRTCL